MAKSPALGAGHHPGSSPGIPTKNVNNFVKIFHKKFYRLKNIVYIYIYKLKQTFFDILELTNKQMSYNGHYSRLPIWR